MTPSPDPSPPPLSPPVPDRCGQPTTRGTPCRNNAGAGRDASYGPCYLHVSEDTPDRSHIASISEFIPFVYRARPISVIDGDTIDFGCDLGFLITRTIRVRLAGIDTAELNSSDPAERDLAQEQAAYVVAWLLDAIEDYPGPWPLVVDTHRDSTGAYGRYLARVYRKSDGRELTSALFERYGESVRY